MMDMLTNYWLDAKMNCATDFEMTMAFGDYVQRLAGHPTGDPRYHLLGPVEAALLLLEID